MHSLARSSHLTCIERQFHLLSMEKKSSRHLLEELYPWSLKSYNNVLLHDAKDHDRHKRHSEERQHHYFRYNFHPILYILNYINPVFINVSDFQFAVQVTSYSKLIKPSLFILLSYCTPPKDLRTNWFLGTDFCNKSGSVASIRRRNRTDTILKLEVELELWQRWML
ncbi:unnamed protein product [Moneuplotes crassus]|uniref:Uncharacterized protein n=1 Tax=Euplotes crassus TaxID=5936 RepID=A0AAD1XSW5_EUPCR|nr:unnamed protein product [Moneuplotes crassus]